MKIGDLVTPTHPGQSKRGIIVEKIEHDEIDRFDTGEVFIVLWNTGQLSEHKSWDLSEEAISEKW